MVSTVMKEAQFRFFAELNDFLDMSKRKIPFLCSFNGDQSVKHLIESMGVPHTEVGRIEVNGLPVNFNYLAQNGDQIDIYPVAAPLDRQNPSGTTPRFVLDNHLGKLAAYLRLLGFDVSYRNDYQDEELAHVSSQEGRILLTRDRRLLMRSIVTQGYCVRSLEPKYQLVEVLQRYNLLKYARPFQRCLRCNGILYPVKKETVLERLEPLTRRYYDEFHICGACSQIYWKGSHYQRMIEFLRQVLPSEMQGGVQEGG